MPPFGSGRCIITRQDPVLELWSLGHLTRKERSSENIKLLGVSGWSYLRSCVQPWTNHPGRVYRQGLYTVIWPCPHRQWFLVYSRIMILKSERNVHKAGLRDVLDHGRVYDLPHQLHHLLIRVIKIDFFLSTQRHIGSALLLLGALIEEFRTEMVPFCPHPSCQLFFPPTSTVSFPAPFPCGSPVGFLSSSSPSRDQHALPFPLEWSLYRSPWLGGGFLNQPFYPVGPPQHLAYKAPFPMLLGRILI